MFLFCSGKEVHHAGPGPPTAPCRAAGHHCRYRAQAGAGREGKSSAWRTRPVSRSAGRAGAGSLHRRRPRHRGKPCFCADPGKTPGERAPARHPLCATGRRRAVFWPALWAGPRLVRARPHPAGDRADCRHDRVSLGHGGGHVLPGGRRHCRGGEGGAKAAQFHRQPAPEPAGQRQSRLTVPAALWAATRKQRRTSALAGHAATQRAQWF